MRPLIQGSVVCFFAAVCCGAAVLPGAAEAGIGSRPCDLYAQDDTPCVAAYSTTRALYAAYVGPLYQVKRATDGATRNIGVLPDGYADAAGQDRFCARTACQITVLFDQSPRHNDLTIEGPGGNGGQDVGVVANQLRITVGGHESYGMYFAGGMGYRDNHTRGVAVGAKPESMYMVTSGTHFNSECCFDFGNAETNGHDNGNGHMDAIYFGSDCWFDWPRRGCYGNGPWVEADMENGLFLSGTGGGNDPSDTGNTNPFVTAMVKNDGITTFAIKDANAQAGALTTRTSSPLPTSLFDPNPPSLMVPSPSKPSEMAVINPPLSGYRPMRREGAIVLGTGGDDSNEGVGSFFEGVVTTGYATNATENAVQANIVAAAYSTNESAAANDGPRIRLAAAGDRLRLVISCASLCEARVRLTLSKATAKELTLRRRTAVLLKQSITGSRSLLLRLPDDVVRRARSTGSTRHNVTVTATANSVDRTSSRRITLRL